MMKILSIIIILISFSTLSAQLDTNSPWPMFRQNVRHTGWTNQNVTGVQKNPVLKWSYTTGNDVNSSPAIGSDGTIYVGSYDNNLYAITNGEVKWFYDTGNSIASSPAIGSDGTIYIGSCNNNLYAINPDGTQKWFYTTGDKIHASSSAVGPDGTIYIGSRDDKLYAITNGSLKWSYTTGDDIDSSPAIGLDGTIYIGSKDNKLYAITNGVLKWSNTTGNLVASSSAVGPDGTVYVGSYDNNLYAITNGEVKWAYSTGNVIYYSSPAIGSDGTIYVGSYDNKLYAITNGALKWSYTTGGVINSSPAIGSDGTIYVGSYDNKLYAITNGALKWSYTTGDLIFYSSPAIGSDGTVYVGSCDNNLYAIKQNNEPVLSWSQTIDYTNDGVDPDIGIDNQYFRFEVKYKDKDNDFPLTNQVWIDLNDNGSYTDAGEKISMHSNSGSYYTNGIVFTNSILIPYAGDGILNYRFYFTDKHGYTPLSTNAPFTNHSLTVVTNGAFLYWTEDTGFIIDGINPNTNDTGQTYLFKVKYKELDNTAPETNQVWIDLDDNGTYEMNERFTMFSNSGTSYTNGVIYTNIQNIFYAGDGILQYRFYFKTASDTAYGKPNNNCYFTVRQPVPVLSWLGTGEYAEQGVNKPTGKNGETFTFKVRYSDENNQSPVIKQLWIDLNDNGHYNDTGEKLEMTAIDAGDTSYSNGKDYIKPVQVNYAGDGVINYRFYFTDGYDDATGIPTQNQSIIITRTAETTLEHVIAGPIPSKTGANNFRFDRLTAQAHIEIYTLTGELVKILEEIDGDGRKNWDLKNSAGEQINRGIYICKITNNNGEKKFLKIAIK